MCRATRVAADFLDFTAFCRCSTGVALHPLKILVSHLAPPRCPRRCRTEIWVWKGVALHGGVAATVAGVALHCATKEPPRRIFCQKMIYGTFPALIVSTLFLHSMNRSKIRPTKRTLSWTHMCATLTFWRCWPWGPQTYHQPCNLHSQLQKCQMPDIENSRTNSRKGCRVGCGKTAEKQPEKHPKRPKNSQNSCFSGVSGVFSGCFSAVLPWPTRHPFRLFCRLFSMSGIWHLCSWPRRLQHQPRIAVEIDCPENLLRLFFALRVITLRPRWPATE